MRSLTVNNLFKISIIFMLLIVSVGSIYAADDLMDSYYDSDFEDDYDLELDDSDWDDDLDDDLDDDSDWDDDLDDDLDEDLDEDLDDDSDWDDDLDDDLDEDLDDDSDWDDDLDDESDYDWDEDFDYEEWDDWGDFDFDEEDLEYSNYTFFNYDFLKFRIISYLEHNGNSSDTNWTESEDFYAKYQIYLANPENYTLNQSSENYEKALKIYESITDSFEDFNLTDNETEYLKFLIIYYLNNYGGNLSQYDDYNFTYYLVMAKAGYFYDEATSYIKFNLNNFKTAIPYVDVGVNVNDSVLENQTNSTGVNNLTMTSGASKDTGGSFLFIFILVLILAVLIFI